MEEVLFIYNKEEYYGEEENLGINNGYKYYYVLNEDGEKKYKQALPIDKVRKLIEEYNKKEETKEIVKDNKIIKTKYKIKTTKFSITEDHFKMVLEHDGNLCLCPNEDHLDETTGSVTFTRFDSENIGIHCWVCGQTWNYYDTLKMIDKNNILNYNKIIQNVDYEKVLEKQTIVKQANYKKIKNNVMQYYSNSFKIEDYYANLQNMNVGNEYLFKQQLSVFSPFTNIKDLELNQNMLNSLKWDKNNETMVIPFSIKNNMRNCFYYKDPRGKYVPVVKWKRYINENEIKDYYDRPIFLQECLENKIKYKNNFIIICEGIKDTFNANLLGYSALTSGGVTNTKPFTEVYETIQMIEKTFDYIVIALDNDKAGNENMYRYINLFNKDKIIILTKLFNYNEDFSDFMYRKLKQDKNFKLTLS